MGVEYFLDTNVLVYLFDKSEPVKRRVAAEIAHPDSWDWAISWQVVQEFCSVALYRFETPFQPADLSEYMDLVLLPHCRIHSAPEIYRQAMAIHQSTQFRYYDSLIISAALNAGAAVLYSEDLQHGRKIENLEIRNPFLP